MGLGALLYQKWNPPAPCTELMTGKTVLITGTTGGLGLAAAKHIVELQAAKLIITARTPERGEGAKKTIETWVKENDISSETVITVVPLDMSNLAAVDTFVELLQQETSSVDAVILNAGTIAAKHQPSADGFEEGLQVNTVSTSYLGLLLLPMLLHTAETTQKPTHLTLVGSGTSTREQLSSYGALTQAEFPLQAFSAPENFPPGALGGNVMYPRTKLLLEYAKRHVATLPALLNADGTPKVIVNSVCPGACKSDLARNFEGAAMQAMSWTFFTMFGRTPEQGTNSFMSALHLGAESQGQLWQHDRIVPEWDAITSGEGKTLSDNLWRELSGVLRKHNPQLEMLA